RLLGLGVSFGRVADADSGEDGAPIIVQLERRPAALVPIPTPVGLLERPDAIERLASQRVQLARGPGVVDGERGGRCPDLGVAARLVIFLAAVEIGGTLLDECTHLVVRARIL